ncbi:MAG: hypothetical protein AB7I33_09480 [Gemmatimonadales bacterium]
MTRSNRRWHGHLLLPLLLCGLPAAGRAQAGPAAGTGAPLGFLGFQAGATLAAIEDQLIDLGGDPLRCRVSRSDSTLAECRATFPDSVTGLVVDVWVASMDRVAGILTLSASPGEGQLLQWRRGLEAVYGRVSPRVQASQWMMQWVRQGRMIRLTWRLASGGQQMSVSLVDGPVLDGWARRGERSEK